MSAVGALLSRAAAALGGPGTGAAIIAGGIVVGAIGGGVIAGGGGQTAGAAGTLAVYACPDSGAPIAQVQAGQRLLTTGRTEDSAWLRIHFPEPGRTEAWVQAGPLELKGAVADLPVAECAPEVAVLAPSFGPGPSLTAIVNLPDPTPTPVTPTPTPSPTPADERPVITALTVSTGRINWDTDRYCPNATTKATFTVKANDDVGLASVTLFWRAPGASSYRQAAMTRTGGSATRGTWQVSLDTGADDLRRAGRLAYYAIATDTAGKTRRIPNRDADSITVNVCENEGPEITKVASLSGNRLFWDPESVGSCQTATNLTAAVKDVDGVRSVTLVYRRPGDGSWRTKPMDDETIRGRWYANLDSLGDRITIPNPPTGTLRWYIRAVDDKGAESRSDTREMTIRRCDSEAEFDGVFPTSESYPCTTSARITIGTYANDRDQPNHGLKVVFHWTLENRRTGAGPISGKMSASGGQGNFYSGVTRTFNGQTFYDGYLTAWAVTTDRYGGTTKSPVDTATLGCD